MTSSRVVGRGYALAALGVVGLSVVVAACSAGGTSDSSGAGCGKAGQGGADLSLGFGGNSSLGLTGIETSGMHQVTQDFYYAPKYPGTGCSGTPGLWGEAVQESLWWFNINKSGSGITRTSVQWRGDSHLEDGKIKLDPTVVNMSQAFIDANKAILDPDGDGTVDMSGGYYDAGDFLKIGITQNFMAHTLGWVLWDFPEVFTATGMRDEALKTLRWSADFFMKNTYVDKGKTPEDPWTWNVVAYGHQVGGAADHSCGWMPPELRRESFCPRQAKFATSEAPASDVTAGAAAALALIGWHFRLVDAEYATNCLNHAIALYEFSKKYAGTKWSVDGLYESEDAYSHLSWAALWLNQVLPTATQPGATDQTALYASHKQDYLDDLVIPGRSWIEKIRGQGPQISCMEQAGSCWTESWTHVWNSLRSGLFVKMAHVLAKYGNQYAKLQAGMQNIAREDSIMWVTGPKTPGGFSKKVDVSWGSGRYNSGGQLVALAYAKAFPDDILPVSDKWPGLEGKKAADVLVPWAKSQSEYLLGKNPINESYMMGFNGYGDHFAAYAHHAATHASIYGECEKPTESRHIAYGALVSGPDVGDTHSQNRCDYGANEITIDYNAAFLGSLAANYSFQGKGQCPDPTFPPSEPPTDEFYTESALNTANQCRTQVTIVLVNETAYPPRYTKDLTVRYYIDASELQAKGIDPLTTVTGKINYDAWPGFPTTISELKPCKLNTSTFYFEMAHPYEFWGRQTLLHGPRTVQLDYGVDNNPSCTWDSSNDFSYTGLKSGDPVKSKQVPAYLSGQLVWGAAPECDEPPVIVVPPPVVL